MSETVKICAIGIICAIICVIIKNYQSSFVIPTRLAGMIVLYTVILLTISPLVDYLVRIMGTNVPDESIKLIIKSLSIAYVTQISSNVCKDCGENSLSLCIDTVGKIEILVLAIPLIERIIKMSEDLASW